MKKKKEGWELRDYKRVKEFLDNSIYIEKTIIWNLIDAIKLFQSEILAWKKAGQWDGHNKFMMKKAEDAVKNALFHTGSST